jgi:uncharacterized protein GlcG (DUF336 family)
MIVSLDTARTIIAAARTAGGEAGFKPLTIVVIDAGGHIVAAERADGASFGRFDIACGKAHGALALGIGSRAIMARAEQQPYFVAAATVAVGGRLVPAPGGVLARDGSHAVVGAVGVPGNTSDNDELAAIAGIQAAALLADPG